MAQPTKDDVNPLAWRPIAVDGGEPRQLKILGCNPSGTLFRLGDGGCVFNVPVAKVELVETPAPEPEPAEPEPEPEPEPAAEKISTASKPELKRTKPKY